jgi:hypothetical protein
MTASMSCSSAPRPREDGVDGSCRAQLGAHPCLDALRLGTAAVNVGDWKGICQFHQVGGGFERGYFGQKGYFFIFYSLI